MGSGRRRTDTPWEPGTTAKMLLVLAVPVGIILGVWFFA